MDMSTIGVISAFTGGLLSFFSPCVFPLIPGYLAYIAGSSIKELRRRDKLWHNRVILRTIFFVAGFSVILIVLGGLAGTAGKFLRFHRRTAEIIGGSLIIVFGLFLTGILQFNFLLRKYSFEPDVQISNLGSFILGLSFGFGWSPCGGPILASIITFASLEQNFWWGAFLLFTYASGIAIPFLVTALLFDLVLSLVENLNNLLRYTQLLAGILLIGLGITLLAGELSILTKWMIELRSF